MNEHGLIGISFNDDPDLIVNLEDIGAAWKSLSPKFHIEEICYSSSQRRDFVHNYDEIAGVRSERYSRGYFIGRRAILTNLGGSDHHLIGIGSSSDNEYVSINWYTLDGRGIEKERRHVKDCGIFYRSNPS